VFSLCEIADSVHLHHGAWQYHNIKVEPRRLIDDPSSSALVLTQQASRYEVVKTDELGRAVHGEHYVLKSKESFDMESESAGRILFPGAVKSG
jgi:hypothetical protein